MIVQVTLNPLIRLKKTLSKITHMPYEKSEISLPEGFVSLGENLSKKVGAAMATFSKQEDGDKIYYPSLYFENVKGLKDLPSE